MSSLFEQLVYWHWWVLGIILLILEIFSPAAFFMWIGFAAGVVGLVKLVIPSLIWEQQFLLFAALSVLAVVLGRSWFKRQPIETDHPDLNLRGAELIGQTYEVVQAITNGAGRIKVGETTWKVAGPDAAVGDKVRVINIDSAVLQVTPTATRVE